MVSRSGNKTVYDHTCFFRGAKGETGGKNHPEAESQVKKLINFADLAQDDVSKDLVQGKDVVQYITVQEFKKEQANKKVLAEIEAQQKLRREQGLQSQPTISSKNGDTIISDGKNNK